MASELMSLRRLETAQGEAAQAQVSTADYGAVGDQRPYQIVQPAYPAPRFLSRYQYLDQALRECGTLCQVTGQPFRLMKWGASKPCYPCRKTPSGDRLPSARIHSVGALAGFPALTPLADFHPGGTPIAYDASGVPQLVGGQNYVVATVPNPPGNFYNPQPLTQRYAEAVLSAQKLASMSGKNTFICSSTGASCKGRDPKKWVPIVYVEPGGLVKRYRHDMKLKGSIPGSDVDVTAVSPEEFQELIRQSEGASRLAWGT